MEFSASRRSLVDLRSLYLFLFLLHRWNFCIAFFTTSFIQYLLNVLTILVLKHSLIERSMLCRNSSVTCSKLLPSVLRSCSHLKFVLDFASPPFHVFFYCFLISNFFVLMFQGCQIRLLTG